MTSPLSGSSQEAFHRAQVLSDTDDDPVHGLVRGEPHPGEQLALEDGDGGVQLVGDVDEECLLRISRAISLGASKKSEATQPNEQVNEKKEVTDTTEETVAPPPRTDEADAEAPKPTEASDEATPDSPEKEAPAETAPPENEEADNPEADEPAITENAEDTPSAETNRNLISKQKQWAKRAKAGRTHTGAKKKFGKKKRKKKGELSNDPMAGFEL
jgi:hypothetical protein